MDEGGTPFGRYRLIEVLGRGGMGEVWRAHDTATNNRTVAIKLLPPHLAADATFAQRFRREADAAARLDSPHVIPIHNYGEIDGRLYVDMRLIKGRDLQSVLTDGPLEPARAVRIIEQVAKALHAAHEIGLVHRDVKPSNILLDKDDFSYLIDFGIARATEETRLTSGGTIGTFAYIAPERLGDNPDEDARADIYALACVLYECLTGHPPFPGTSVASLLSAHLHTPPPQPSTTNPSVPPGFDKVIATGMAKDPDLRYATTVELATAAHDAITVPMPTPASPPVVEYPTPAPPAIAGPTLVATPEPQPLVPARPPAPHGTAGATIRYRPSPIPTPGSQPPPGPRRWWARKVVLIPTALLAAVALTVAVVLATRNDHGRPPPSLGYGPQIVLPFTDVNTPYGVAVDGVGSVYVTDTGSGRVLKLAAGSTAPSVLPFAGLSEPCAVAVDGVGSVYVTDTGSGRVLKLAAGSTAPSVLPFAGLSEPCGVAVDGAGNVYVTNNGNNRVLKLAGGVGPQTDLSFTGVSYPRGVAVDGAGNVYVADAGNDRVLKLAGGVGPQTELPFTGWPQGVAVDGAGNVYVAEYGSNQVVELADGSGPQTELPFAGLKEPEEVAVDSAGAVYVADSGNHRVLKLPMN